MRGHESGCEEKRDIGEGKGRVEGDREGEGGEEGEGEKALVKEEGKREGRGVRRRLC